eukprot:TRINITY_DN4485_c0_g1_i4.p3 TRINITY_DN4485_c0_g1~~TRINITY_DN4485_c0_g1_i4.p3  ORF type:complete len:111 (+),score=21.59 TRINITY_DN4485_c0_g1_i4:667-999(+)
MMSGRRQHLQILRMPADHQEEEGGVHHQNKPDLHLNSRRRWSENGPIGDGRFETGDGNVEEESIESTREEGSGRTRKRPTSATVVMCSCCDEEMLCGEMTARKGTARRNT